MPATRKKIGEILKSSQFDDSDKWVIKWQFGVIGDFEKSLAQAIVRADEGNLDRLWLGFPVQVTGFRRWAHGDLGRRLRSAGLDI